jgi:diguanylate cyclase (GGDEF)-like protein
VSTGAVVVGGLAPTLAWGHRLHSPLLAVAVPVLSAGVLMVVKERLEREGDAMRDVALTDPLTGIANRRCLLGRTEYEIARHARSRRSFALLMMDLDGFKLVNDRFGHAAGDDLLRDVAVALTNSIRAQDTAARIGGDEFCVLAPETDERGSNLLADRISRAISEVPVGIESLRATIGVSVFPADGVSPVALLDAADQRLLAFKRGRLGAVTRRAA